MPKLAPWSALPWLTLAFPAQVFAQFFGALPVPPSPRVPGLDLSAQCGGQPTLAQCQNDHYLDSQCAEPHLGETGTCSELVEEAMLAQRSRARISTIDRDLTASGVDEVIPETGLEGDEHYTPDPYSLRSQYAAVAYGESMPLPAASIPGADQLTNHDIYELWEANDDRVRSCEEYVYERFYDINVFHRALGEDARDPERVLEVAFGPPTQDASIGSRHLTSATLRGFGGRNSAGRPFGTLYDGEEVPKNAFFDIPERPYPADEAIAPIGPDLHQSIRNYSELGDALLATIEENRDASSTVATTWPRAHWMWEELVYHEPTPTFDWDDGRGGREDDDGFDLAAVTGRPPVRGSTTLTDSIDPARELLGTVEGHPYLRRHLAEELDELYQAQGELHGLLREWMRANVRFRNSGWTPDALLPDPPPLGALELTARPRTTHSGLVGRATSLLALDRGPDLTNFVAQTGGETSGPARGGSFEIDPPTDPEETIVRRRIVKRLTELLEQAADAGCLETGLTPCDWSPLAFARDMRQTFGYAQDQAYYDCQSLVDGIAEGTDQSPTGGNLYAMLGRTYTFVPAGEAYACAVSVPSNLTGVGLESLAPEIAECRQRQIQQEEHDAKEELAANTPLYDEATGTWKNPGFIEEGGEDMGNEYFGLDYDYRYGWELDLADGVCGLDAWAGARFGAGATIFRHRQSLVDFEASLDTADVDGDNHVIDVHAHVFGTPVFTDIHVDQPDNDPTLEWSRSVDFSEGFDVPLFDSRFVIVVVPVRLTAGVAGRAGIELGLGVDLQGFVDDECPRVDVTGEVRPYLRFSGFVQAGIDIGIAAAGIRGELDIVRADVPFRPEISIAMVSGAIGSSPQPVDLELTVRSNLSLELSTLSGSLSAYAKAGICPICAKGRWTIVEWDGPRWDQTLASHEYEASLGTLALVYGE